MSADNAKSDQESKALEMIKACFDDGEATVNDRTYKFHNMTHPNRLKVFAYSSTIQNQMKNGNVGFMGTKEWFDIEEIINKHVSFNGDLLSKIKHWEKFPEDYFLFVQTALGVISYPFMKGRKSS